MAYVLAWLLFGVIIAGVVIAVSSVINRLNSQSRFRRDLFATVVISLLAAGALFIPHGSPTRADAFFVASALRAR